MKNENKKYQLQNSVEKNPKMSKLETLFTHTHIYMCTTNSLALYRHLPHKRDEPRKVHRLSLSVSCDIGRTELDQI
jgi:uncharacterized pyridoxamine 5'-phosphate oxidase family protein